MVVTNWSKNQIMLFVAGSQSSYPEYFIIGAGSSVVSASNTELVSATDRQIFTSVSYPSSTKLQWQGDWNALEVSGLTLQEMGAVASGAGLTGSIWSRIVIPSVTFDGSNELRIEETWEFY